MKTYLLDMSPEELKKFVVAEGEKEFRSKQILSWIYSKFASSFEEMTDLPAHFREHLSQTASVRKFTLLAVKRDPDEAKRYLWGVEGKAIAESVLLKYKYGTTACLSTQVGCPVGCFFCASQILGYERNLSRGEIIEQFLSMCKDQGDRIGHIVFMGTGEPFLNYDELMGAVDILSHREAYGISRRKITVSTVGIPDAIYRYIKDSRGARLAVSLHASSDEVRSSIIPLNRAYPLGKVVEAARTFALETGQRITFEYMLIAGVNDSATDALQLVGLLSGIDCLVNLIPYNEVPGVRFERPSPRKVREFQDVLERNHMKVTVRRSLGSEIEAACGQLRRESAVSRLLPGGSKNELERKNMSRSRKAR